MKLHKLLVGLLVMGLLVCLSTAQDAVDDAEDDSDVEEDDGAAEEVTPGVPREKPQYKAPEAKGNAFFSEAFESQSAAEKTWVISQAKKDGADEAIAKYDGKWEIEEASDNPMVGDLGLVLKTKAKHHAISAALDRPFKFEGNPLIVQYEVKFQNDQECGGAYVKLLSQDAKLNLPAFNDQTPYTIMFGPDKCGQDHKLHFIFRHKNPIKGTFEEKHAKKPTADLSKYFTDKKTHLYTLAVHPDNMFEVFVDQELVNSGSLLEDMTPAVNPPKEIVDPNDSKPADWDEREKIADPEASKPEDWDEDEPEMITDPDAKKPEGWLDDEPELIPDPEAEKPTDWDDDMDGEWEAPQINNPKCADAPGCGTWKAPQIKNPKYKGKWRAPMIDNPNYKGKWKPSMIANPDYFEDKQPFKMTPIAAIGLELWSMSNEILFDNFIITDSKTVADNWAEDSWEIKHAEEIASKSSGQSLVNAVKDMTAERPWLWAVILIVVILPIVLLIAYCCSGSGSSEKEQEAERKKTDAPSPDVEEEEEAEKEGSEEAAASTEDAAADPGAAGDAPAETTTTTKTKKASKAALEAEEVDEAEVSQESQEEEEEEGKEASDTEKRRTSPRKRRSRKD